MEMRLNISTNSGKKHLSFQVLIFLYYKELQQNLHLKVIMRDFIAHINNNLCFLVWERVSYKLLRIKKHSKFASTKKCSGFTIVVPVYDICDSSCMVHVNILDRRSEMIRRVREKHNDNDLRIRGRIRNTWSGKWKLYYEVKRKYSKLVRKKIMYPQIGQYKISNEILSFYLVVLNWIIKLHFDRCRNEF